MTPLLSKYLDNQRKDISSSVTESKVFIMANLNLKRWREELFFHVDAAVAGVS